MAKTALIVWGGWDGHEPGPVSEALDEALRAQGFATELSNTLDALLDVEKLKGMGVIVPVWTMGRITGEQLRPLMEAVESGVGIGGCHGGMCDAFRDATDYQFMTGGNWVSHPGGSLRYTVEVKEPDHYIMQGTRDFEVTSEQYYLHTDPVNRVLATTRFPLADGPHAVNGPVDMPVVWTRMWGKGRVFYCSLGHDAKVVRQPEVLRLLTRGLVWAARAEE
jgi:type 1 glutamine amidotransferase